MGARGGSNLEFKEVNKVRANRTSNKFASIGDDYGTRDQPRRTAKSNGRRAGPRSATYRGKPNNMMKSSLNSQGYSAIKAKQTVEEMRKKFNDDLL